jgi:hypothetical protein
MEQHPASSGPYREASEPPPDEEVIALARLVARAQRMRRMIGVPIVTCGVLLGAAVYAILRAGVFEGIDARAPYLIVLLTVLPLIVLAQTLAAYAGRKAIVVRSPVWIAEMTTPGTSPALLEAFVRSL